MYLDSYSEYRYADDAQEQLNALEVERQQTEIPERMALQVNKIKILKRICGEAYPFSLLSIRRSGKSMKYQVQENCLTIYLPREVDHHNAEEIKAEADAVIDRNHIRYVIFDFDRTDFMDSSGIGVIMGRYKTISLIGGEVWAVHTNERIRKILTLSGVTKIMQIYEEERV